jgi:hypothetical protein
MTTITISITIPDGATVSVDNGPPVGPPAQTFTPVESTSDWVCPEHGGARVVPAGVSKKTGKPYPAFRVCMRQECDQKEPANR